MPLSEEELRLLEQMERALTEEDPKFASTLRGTSLRRSARRHAILAGLVFVVGVAVLMAGVITRYWPIGILGFVVMLGSATVGMTAVRGQRIGAIAGLDDSAPHARQHHSGFSVVDGGRSSRLRHPSAHRPGARGSFMNTLRARWRRRRELGGW
ncbi:MAG: DUF3040 domain-containing protein [Nocardioidaceae bacterium]|nr:DUF3040 domain-containing protein [Nocardioidaceae bacterium]MCL2614595.1 DUF3040 domain-containing protein [Nocardioidaceae bacterium]